ncbi:GNAT family N-acetyltransferase [Streptomyces sp. SP17BM10]|uniref:GNAT family N-acetyltransferase n=1 Tax=Streptomyces sp. SP17BM10 TaxID=3002530 RepID=UPI002E78E6E5|nr:GNAT family N-acetyltransferase [Streptomyces sp. SP17BM10]MEE1788984.1 GNAT family N-acetyltransferase [Streptomyces sp. SP17BM10]
MPLISLHDRSALAARFLADPALHLFELGDLDDTLWPNTTWYTTGGPVALLYTGGDVPVLLAFARPAGVPALEALLAELRPFLPRRFTAMLPVGTHRALEPDYGVEHRSTLLRMMLPAEPVLPEVTGEPVPLTGEDVPDLRALLAEAYPGSWFDERLVPGGYVGLRGADGRLLATAGVHVRSAAYGVAVLGNVTTRPDARGRGLARACVTALCHRLAETTAHIGLNVRTDNAPAIHLYERLGFTSVATFEELVIAGR